MADLVPRLKNNLCAVPTCTGAGHTSGLYSSHRSYQSCPVLKKIRRKDAERAEEIVRQITESPTAVSQCPYLGCDGKGNISKRDNLTHRSLAACPLYNQDLLQDNKQTTSPPTTNLAATNSPKAGGNKENKLGVKQAAQPVDGTNIKKRKLEEVSLLKAKKTKGIGETKTNVDKTNIQADSQQNATDNELYEKVIANGSEDADLMDMPKLGSKCVYQMDVKSPFMIDKVHHRLGRALSQMSIEIKKKLAEQVDLYHNISLKEKEIKQYVQLRQSMLGEWRKLCSGIALNIDGVLVLADEVDNFSWFLEKLVAATGKPSFEAHVIRIKFLQNCTRAGLIQDHWGEEEADVMNSQDSIHASAPLCSACEVSAQVEKVLAQIVDSVTEGQISATETEVDEAFSDEMVEALKVDNPKRPSDGLSDSTNDSNYESESNISEESEAMHEDTSMSESISMPHDEKELFANVLLMPSQV